VQDGRSFLSVRLKRNKFRTEETGKRDASPERVRPSFRHETQPDEPFQRVEANTFFFKSIVTLIEKEPQKLKTPKFIFENNAREESIVFPKSKKRSKSTSQRLPHEPALNRRAHTRQTPESSHHSPLHARLQPALREESVKRLKTFFLQKEGQAGQAGQAGKEVKWKNMIEKSNRKKKELESLFKTRMLVGRNQVEQRIVANRIDQMFAAQLGHQRQSRAKFRRDEFNDSALFCPWNYNQDKLISHLRNKQT
jgi:hypothetical protein